MAMSGACVDVLLTLRGVACRAPGEPFRLALVRDAGLDELVVAGLGQLHGVPFALLADCIHPGLPAVDGHPVDNPGYALLILDSPSPLLAIAFAKMQKRIILEEGC